MDQDLYEIAKRNLKYKKRSAIAVIAGVVAFIFLFPMFLIGDSDATFFLIMAMVMAGGFFGIAYFLGRKVVTNKKDPVIEEMKRLKEHHGEEYDELELKELKPKYRDDELV